MLLEGECPGKPTYSKNDNQDIMAAKDPGGRLSTSQTGSQRLGFHKAQHYEGHSFKGRWIGITGGLLIGSAPSQSTSRPRPK